MTKVKLSILKTELHEVEADLTEEQIKAIEHDNAPEYIIKNYVTESKPVEVQYMSVGLSNV